LFQPAGGAILLAQAPRNPLDTMPEFDQRRIVNERLLDLCRGDPFVDVLRRAETHRESHGPSCGLYPAGPHVMRLVATIVQSSRATRVLDLGTGFGYSALWLASAGARVEAIDRWPEHIATAEECAAHTGLADRIEFMAGEVSEVLDRLVGPYDLIHDDAWFAVKPPYFERVIELLRRGGTLTMPNWFLLEDAITGAPRRDWSELAGPHWAESTLAYARSLASDPRLHVAWSVSPPLGVAVKGSSPFESAPSR
jgi:predicted O-methyltransferase YrrM